MKKILNIKLFIAWSFITSVALLSSCIDDGSNEIEGKGPSRFRMILSEGTHDVAFDSFTGPGELIEVWRDANSVAAISKSASVKIEIDDSIIDDFNATAEPEDQLTVFDASFYTIENPTIEFAAGEFSKNVEVTLNAPSDLDLSKAYGIGVRLIDASTGYEVSNTGLEGIVTVLVKNPYDGLYTKKGIRYNFSSVGEANQSSWPPTGFISSSAFEFKNEPLPTINANTISAPTGNLGSNGFGLMYISVNPDNSVSVDGADAGLNLFQLNSNFESYYDPETKTFHMYTQWTNTNGTHRLVYETFTYTGKR